jgi:hypothetical protein
VSRCLFVDCHCGYSIFYHDPDPSVVTLSLCASSTRMRTAWSGTNRSAPQDVLLRCLIREPPLEGGLVPPTRVMVDVSARPERSLAPAHTAIIPLLLRGS